MLIYAYDLVQWGLVRAKVGCTGQNEKKKHARVAIETETYDWINAIYYFVTIFKN